MSEKCFVVLQNFLFFNTFSSPKLWFIEGGCKENCLLKDLYIFVFWEKPQCTAEKATEDCLCGLKGLITCRKGLYCHGHDSAHKSQCKKQPAGPPGNIYLFFSWTFCGVSKF
jgi:hypothetical protein